MPFTIIQNDITKVAADAIVNTANSRPVFGRGTDQAIFSAAGPEELLEARRKIGDLKRGEAVATEAFGLSAKYIIHTVGPKWQGGGRGEYEVLASCYRKSLQLAKILQCGSIAFPLIAAGTHGFPKAEALDVALREIRAFLEDNEMDVTLVVYDKRVFELSMERAGEVERFLGEWFTGPVWESGAYAKFDAAPQSLANAPLAEYEEEPCCEETAEAPDLEKMITEIGDTFQQRLLKLIDEKGMTDPQVYKKANLDRKLFSKIRSNPDYHPGKKTALALAIALELDLNETTDLLARAELALSPGSKFDLIIEYCIRKKLYDIFEINAILFEYDLPLLA